MNIFNILSPSLLFNKIFAYNHNTLKKFVDLISYNNYNHHVNLNYCIDMHNGILVMDNIYFYHDSNQFELYLSLCSFSQSFHRRIEVYDELTAAFLKFIYNYKDLTTIKMTYIQFEERFRVFLSYFNNQIKKFTSEDILILTKKMFGVENTKLFEDGFYIDNQLINHTINQNRHIFIDCNLPDMEEEIIIFLDQFNKETNQWIRLTQYFLFFNDLIYHYPILNDRLANESRDITNTNKDYLYLTEYANINKYFYEIMHFIKISNNILREYVFYEPLQYLVRNNYGIIEQGVPKQINTYTESGITN